MCNRSCFSDTKNASRGCKMLCHLWVRSLSRAFAWYRCFVGSSLLYAAMPWTRTTEALSLTVHNDAIFINEATGTASFRSSGIWNFLISVSRMLNHPPCPVAAFSFPLLLLYLSYPTRTWAAHVCDQGRMKILSLSLLFLFLSRNLSQCAKITAKRIKNLIINDTL